MQGGARGPGRDGDNSCSLELHICRWSNGLEGTLDSKPSIAPMHPAGKHPPPPPPLPPPAAGQSRHRCAGMAKQSADCPFNFTDLRTATDVELREDAGMGTPRCEIQTSSVQCAVPITPNPCFTGPQLPDDPMFPAHPVPCWPLMKSSSCMPCPSTRGRARQPTTRFCGTCRFQILQILPFILEARIHLVHTPIAPLSNRLPRYV